MRRNFKKTLAVMLAVIMILVALPLGINSFAAEEYANGDIIEFGSYPQSRVKDSDLIAELETQQLNWVSYGYYSGNGEYNSATQGDWMKYADVEYNGEKYRCVNFSQYRPFYTFYASNSSNTWQYKSGYRVNNNYWFKFEPIEWKILDAQSGLVLSNMVIDSQAYNNICHYPDYTTNNDSSNPIKANDYEQSSIRKWLNDDFSSTAFNEHELWSIKETQLENKAHPTYPQFDKASTTDKVFLLSVADVSNPDYGFATSLSSDKKRDVKPTDYAKSQGVYVYASGRAKTLLRSAGWDDHSVCNINYGGIVSYTCYSDVPDVGIRPALQLDFFRLNHEHSYAETTVNPTCTKDGAVMNVCDGCGDSKVISVIPATGHIDTNDDGVCEVCNEVFDATKTCSHICHKGGIAGFFYKIARMFWKLFKINQYCECGAAHY